MRVYLENKMTDEEYQERLEIVAGDEPDFSFPIYYGEDNDI